jgi:hypothetical protein
MMMKMFKFFFLKKDDHKHLSLSEKEVAEYQKSKDDLALANKQLQKVIEENHFTLNIKKALPKNDI